MNYDIFKKEFPNIYLQNVVTIYESGSIEEGFGNSTSDNDLYLIIKKSEGLVEENEFYWKRDNKFDTLNSIVNGQRYDLEFIDYYKIQEITAFVNKFRNDGKQSIALLTTDWMNILHRLKYAKCIYNEIEFNHLLENIDFNKLSLLFALKNIYIYDSSIEDCQGSYYEDDPITCYFHIYNMVVSIYDSYACLRGETNANRKWIFKKLSRLYTTVSDNAYIDFLTKLNKASTLLKQDLNWKSIVDEILYDLNELRDVIFNDINVNLKRGFRKC